MTSAEIRIRHAAAGEAPVLEDLQRRSSHVWAEYREQLTANPDAIELPQSFVDSGWVRVAVAADGTPIGFSVVIPSGGPAQGFYGKLGFELVGTARTRFGPAVRMRRGLSGG
jgi:hypothetical protein